MKAVSLKWPEGGNVALRFSFGAMCAFEDEAGRSLISAVREIESMGENLLFKPLVPVLRAGMSDDRPGLTDDEVIAVANGHTLMELVEAIGAAAVSSFGDDEGASGNAPKAGKKATAKS